MGKIYQKWEWDNSKLGNDIKNGRGIAAGEKNVYHPGWVWSIQDFSQIYVAKCRETALNHKLTGKVAASPLWVGSPVYRGGVKGDVNEQDKNREVKQQANDTRQQLQRQRKPSIFLHQVGLRPPLK